jgi:hypothetical protein
MAVNRLDTKGVHETHFDKKQLIDTFKDVKIWTLAVLHVLLVTPLYSIAFFIPSIVKEMGYTSVVAQLMTAPLMHLPFFSLLETHITQTHNTNELSTSLFPLSLPL